MIDLESLERALLRKTECRFSASGALATPLPIWAKPRGKGRASTLGEAKNSPRAMGLAAASGALLPT